MTVHSTILTLQVGGFFGNPTTALLVRWYQAACFHPFLRAHAEFKTKRREPYLFGEEVTRQVRQVLEERYALLPYLYTLFEAHRADGALVMRPMWHEFPHDPLVRGEAWWAAPPAAPATAEKVAVEKAAAEGGEDGEAAGGGEAMGSAEESGDDGAAAEHAAEGAVEPSAEEAVAGAGAAEGGATEMAAASGGGDEGAEGDTARALEETSRITEAGGGADAAATGVDMLPECPCFKCDDTPCYPPTCGSCGSKEASGCRMVSGVAYPPWGCYTTADTDCKCEKEPKYGTDDFDDDEYRHWGDEDEMGRGRYRGEYGEDEDYDRYAHSDEYRDDEYRYRGGDDDDDDGYKNDDEVAKTDYNEEYYHGEAKADDQDEGQAQTGEQFMLGPHLLVQPITSMTVTETKVYLPAEKVDGSAAWYDLHTSERFVSTAGARVITVPVHADHVPAFLRGGAVLPRRERARRSARATCTPAWTRIASVRSTT